MVSAEEKLQYLFPVLHQLKYRNKTSWTRLRRHVSCELIAVYFVRFLKFWFGVAFRRWRITSFILVIIASHLLKRYLVSLWIQPNYMEDIPKVFKHDFFHLFDTRYKDSVNIDGSLLKTKIHPMIPIELFNHRPNMERNSLWMCNRPNRTIHTLFLIMSHVSAVEERAFIRNTWLNKKCSNLGMKDPKAFIFITGDINLSTSAALNRKMILEHQQHGDVLQLSEYDDKYINDYHKIVSGFNFTLYECSNIRFAVLLTSSEVVVDIRALDEKLSRVSQLLYPHFAASSVVFHQKPPDILPTGEVRPAWEYEFSYFLNYPHSILITSGDIARHMAIAIQFTRKINYFHEPLLGIILNKLGVELINWSEICTDHVCTTNSNRMRPVAASRCPVREWWNPWPCKVTMYREKIIARVTSYCKY
ncbi:hypothetical protein Ciccas_011424 [Cichlidogyrus casuarinus]|uniref:Hexosyltransferase n=1 Tax=Cichlidogyrus casuarinus TaxID=1844966 RepID=A0ABD2PU76_9PLAT